MYIVYPSIFILLIFFKKKEKKERYGEEIQTNHICTLLKKNEHLHA